MPRNKWNLIILKMTTNSFRETGIIDMLGEVGLTYDSD